jgi:putative addiction module component (TIGR02574 family)
VTQEANDLLKKALELAAEDRAALAGILIDSLDTTADSSVEEAWNDEIARRILELDSGKTKTRSWTEVRRRISTKLGDDR